MSSEKPRYFLMAIVTVVLLAIGIAVIWITKEMLGIEGDIVYIGLLLIPFLVYLALTGKLAEMSIFGATASFVNQRTREIQQDVVEIGEYEPERSVYLGKLKQVMRKDGQHFALIYADIDKLRSVTRKLYNEEKEKARENPDIPRRSDKDLRKSIIKQLALALSDAFFDEDIDEAKQDIFLLEEPDVVMIVRSVDFKQAKKIAEKALESFKMCGYSATMVVQSPMSTEELNPRKLDKTAADELQKRKSRDSEGKVYESA